MITCSGCECEMPLVGQIHYDVEGRPYMVCLNDRPFTIEEYKDDFWKAEQLLQKVVT